MSLSYVFSVELAGANRSYNRLYTIGPITVKNSSTFFSYPRVHYCFHIQVHREMLKVNKDVVVTWSKVGQLPSSEDIVSLITSVVFFNIVKRDQANNKPESKQQLSMGGEKQVTTRTKRSTSECTCAEQNIKGRVT